MFSMLYRVKGNSLSLQESIYYFGKLTNVPIVELCINKKPIYSKSTLRENLYLYNGEGS